MMPDKAQDARTPTWLLEHRRNVYSQSGEDGVLEKVLEMLPSRDRWCVEFGAWDGEHLSNTRHLIERHGYRAVLIEADPAKYRKLAARYQSAEHVHAINAFVGFAAEDGLDHLLDGLPIAPDFDLLSIDIDGNDFHAWKATVKYQPKVVCVEFNPTIPTEVDFVQAAADDVSQGASLRALVRLGAEKGYELVSVLLYNAIFVKREFYSLFGIGSNLPEVLRLDTRFVTWIFSGYDGRVIISGCKTLPWHGIEMREGRIQHLPRFLMKYPDGYSRWQALALRALHWAARLRSALRLVRRDPKELVKRVRRVRDNVGTGD